MPEEFDWTNHPHRRYNSLTGDWVLVSPHRTKRPWQGQVEKLAAPAGLHYDPSCYLCPGNERAGGHRNPPYETTFVFQNDFAALLPDTPEAESNTADLLIAKSERGVCRVVCFSPRHDLTMAGMSVPELRFVVDTWVAQFDELGALPHIQHVQIFENRGEMMGASNPHPHCQIWANSSVPDLVAREGGRMLEWYVSRRVCLLCDYLAIERERGERIVCENEHFTVLVPYWAIWPFETMVLSRSHATGIDQLDSTARDGLAEILQKITAAYDRLFETSFPYSFGFHQRPTDGLPHPEWHLHGHFLPPLLRSATVRKFMVGYELLAGPQRDVTAESAAARLRGLF